MNYLARPTPDILRQIDNLKVLGNPGDAPEWLIPSYIADCMENMEIQKNWKPKIGDWYLCIDLCKVMKIDSLRSYFSAGQVSLSSDSSIGSISNGGCDVYLPNPEDLESRIS